MRQYLEVKDKHPDSLVLFRLGDFYEMFFEDAVLGARLLDLTLTTRDKGKEDAVPMCGVPHHAARGYIAKLTELGYRVVMVEQVEDPRLAKGLVKREVARIITPGIVLDDEVLEPKLPRYVAALVAGDKPGSGKAGANIERQLFGLAYLDATTGELRATTLSIGELLDEVVRVAPREILVESKQLGESSSLSPIRMRYRAAWNAYAIPAIDVADKTLEGIALAHARADIGASATTKAKRGTKAEGWVASDGAGGSDAGLTRSVSRSGSGSGSDDGDFARDARADARDVRGGDFESASSPSASPSPIIPIALSDVAKRAAAAVLAYARATQPTGTIPVTRIVSYDPSDSVVLDETAIANLELVETLIGKKKQGSLLDVVDQTVTAPGGRLLRRWLLYPLIDVPQIRRRQDAVAWLVHRPALTEELRRALGRIADLERLAGKATLGVATPRDLGRLRDALQQLPDLVHLIHSGATKLDPVPPLLALDPARVPALAKLAARLVDSISDEPPPMLKDGGVIRAGYDKTVDECRELADGGKNQILAIEEREQRDSGIPSLKVRYNRVFGYYIEITKSHLAKVPPHYARKQTIATGERFVTPELAELEKKVVAAEETLAIREAELVREEVTAVAAIADKISAAGAALAIADVCASLAEVAARRNYCRPIVDDSSVLEITDGRHPVIEAMLADGAFVPNDCRLDPDSDQLVLITGPNMAGKSTYMRQVAQIALLAQIGAFVPARAATIGVCDRVFTRVGAADNLSRGDSTFMVEMRETATILAKSTRRSLIILDEVGRGTSTFDGVSIAWAVAEHLHDAIGARTLFATHYHELVALAESRPRVRNVSVAVREHKNEIVFLRRVVPGGANKSYGIDVARLAGLPKPVIGRSREIMGKLEGGHAQGASLGSSAQLSLLPKATPNPLIAKLAAIDLNHTTPFEALQLLAELKSLV
ncbi:MAG: DNA mismatch repair protein MutS [Kofleriaceae bacterium]